MIARLDRMLRPQASVMDHGNDSERGLTLIELIVAMMVFSILLALVGTLYVTGQRVVTTSSFTAQDTGVASNVMNELTDVLRYATTLPDPSDATQTIPAFVQATSTSVVLYSYANSGTGANTVATPQTVMVGFFLGADGTVTEKRWSTTGATLPGAAAITGTTPTSTRVLGGPLIAPTTSSAPAGACQDPNATAAPTPDPGGTASATAVPPLFTFCSSNQVVDFASGGIPTASLGDLTSVVVNISMNTGASRGEHSVVLAGTIDVQNFGATAEGD